MLYRAFEKYVAVKITLRRVASWAGTFQNVLRLKITTLMASRGKGVEYPTQNGVRTAQSASEPQPKLYLVHVNFKICLLVGTFSQIALKWTCSGTEVYT